MARPLLRSSVFAVIAVLSLVLVSCDSATGDGDTSTTVGDTVASSSSTSSTTTEAPVTSLAPEQVPGSASESIPADVEAQMRSEIGVIALDVEESRGLPFLEVPIVTILDEEAFTERVNRQLQEDIDSEELADQEAMFKLLGMLPSDVVLEDLLVALLTEQVAGFYDGDAKEMVVPVSADGITPLQEIVIAHELVHALTDQHFEFNDTYEQLIEDGSVDDTTAYQAVIEGDATYQQFLYLEDMDPARAAQAAVESLAIDTDVLDAAPEWIQQDLTFPYEYGLRFTGFVVGEGGLKGVDETYLEPPISSEQIIDPNKYLRGEEPLPLEALVVDLPGWELADEATLGEWGIRLLLLETLTPGSLSQAAAGWGNDTYQLYRNGNDTTFVWSYLGESVEDAEDLANGLVEHARDVMGAGGAAESGGGLLFDTGSPWVFIDRIDDEIFFIASTDAAAGENVRGQLGIEIYRRMRRMPQ